METPTCVVLIVYMFFDWVSAESKITEREEIGNRGMLGLWGIYCIFFFFFVGSFIFPSSQAIFFVHNFVARLVDPRLRRFPVYWMGRHGEVLSAPTKSGTFISSFIF